MLDVVFIVVTVYSLSQSVLRKKSYFCERLGKIDGFQTNFMYSEYCVSL